MAEAGSGWLRFTTSPGGPAHPTARQAWRPAVRQAGMPALHRGADILVCRFADFPVGCTVPRPKALRLTQRPGRPGGPRYGRQECLRYLIAPVYP